VTTCVLTFGSRRTRPLVYTEQSREASSTECRILPCRVIEGDFPNRVTVTRMETRPRVVVYGLAWIRVR
jgi:hypothetical protein